MTPHRKKSPLVAHFNQGFNVPRDWFETNSWHQKRYFEGGEKKSWVSRSTGKSSNLATLSRYIVLRADLHGTTL